MPSHPATNVHELLASLGSESDDYWHDVGVEESERYCQRLSVGELELLTSMIRSIGNGKRERLAYVLAAESFERAFPLLTELIGLGSITACDSLRALLEAEQKRETVSTHTIAAIDELLSIATEPWLSSIRKLKSLLVVAD